ncbi:MAG: hypothetical protein R6V12_20400 [Candidatus Hydrogenedentota bacterium]
MKLCEGILIAVFLIEVASAQTVFDTAKPQPLPEGAPRASDVIMRSLRVRPRNAQDSHNTLEALDDFHVTRLEWAYINDPAFIAKVKARGCLFGGAASAPSYNRQGDDPEWFEKVVIKNLEGEPIIAPWKRNWNRTLWGCVNTPKLERGYLECLKQYLDAGAEVMQRDEPRANLLAVHWGGCFCDYCMAGFRTWLAENTTREQRQAAGVDALDTFDYREHLRAENAPVGDAFGKWDGGQLKKWFIAFQETSTLAFHERMRAGVDDYAGRRVPFSCNNGARRWGAVELMFDWAFGELSYGHATAVQIYNTMREARSHGKGQVVTMPKSSKWETTSDLVKRTRCTIAMAYACGGHCMVPWDTYMPGDTPRYFGTPEQYADMFAFIRGNAAVMDGYEEAAAFGKGIGDERFGDEPLVKIVDNEMGFAVVRAVPGDASKPVAIHLIDWSDAPGPLLVRLSPARFWGDKPFAAELRTPVPYDRDAHANAEKGGDFSKLVRTVSVRIEEDNTLTLPAVKPWGILVLTPEEP